MQQDGATAHTAKASRDTLKAKFSNRLISQKTAFPWPTRSPDLGPLDFFLWEFLKGRIYRVQPQTLTELKDSISVVLLLSRQNCACNVWPTCDAARTSVTS